MARTFRGIIWIFNCEMIWLMSACVLLTSLGSAKPFSEVRTNNATLDTSTKELTYKTDGGVRSETSHLKSSRDGSVVKVVEGRYEHISPKNTKIIVHYTADETGFHANFTLENLGGKRVGTNVIASLAG